MTVRALLIKPRKVCAQRGPVHVNFEPLGLLSIAAFVRKYSPHAVSMIDAQAESPVIRRIEDRLFRMGLSDDALRQRIAAIDPHVVGISALFEANEAEVIHLATIVKSINRRIVVVVGGLDAGVRYEKYLVSGVIDLAVRGDGEETFVHILQRIDAREELTGMPGTAERLDDGTCRLNAPRVPSVPFDDYPYPARDLLPRRLYDRASTQGVSFRFARGRPALLMQASRGCRLKCAFCDIVAVQDKWRAHSPEYVVAEIEHCIARYGMREVTFVDDNFMMDKKWALRICELIIERRIKVSIDIMPGIAVWTLSESMIDLMIQAGLHRVLFPIESGNPESIRFMKKPVNLDRVARMIDYCNRKGLYTYANIIIGFPFETERDIQTTIEWAHSTGADQVYFNTAEPFVDSGMYSIYRDNNWVRHDGHQKWWRSQYFSREELDRIAFDAARTHLRKRLLFYLTPSNVRPYLLPKISSLAKLRFALKMALLVLFDGPRSTDRRPTAVLQLPSVWRAVRRSAA